MAQVAEALAEHTNAGNDWACEHLLSEPRAIAPDAEIVEIVEQIHVCWPKAAHRKQNPVRYALSWAWIPKPVNRSTTKRKAQTFDAIPRVRKRV